MPLVRVAEGGRTPSTVLGVVGLAASVLPRSSPARAVLDRDEHVGSGS